MGRWGRARSGPTVIFNITNEGVNLVFAEAILGATVITAVYYDVRERRIPNWITVPALVLGLALHTVRGGLSGLAFALTGAALGAALLMLPFIARWVGGGDLKLLAAIGALMGGSFALWTLVFASAVGGIVTIFWLATSGSLASSLVYVFTAWKRTATTKPVALSTGLCFGPAMGVGALLTRFLV